MVRENYPENSRTTKLVLSGIFLTLIIAGAFIKIPLGLVPVTLQFAMVLLTATFSGGRRGAFIVAAYLLMGLTVIPVFSQGGGPSYIFNPTFGYLIGMLVCAWVTGTLKERAPEITFSRSLIINTFGMLIVYSLGVIYMYFILNFYMGKTSAISPLIVKGALLFIPTDFFWCVVVAVAEVRMKNIVKIMRSRL